MINFDSFFEHNFLLAQSNRSKLDDAYAPVKISEGEITQVFFEMTFLN